MPEIKARPLAGRPPWTVAVGPSGFHLTDGQASVYIDLGEIQMILQEGQEHWSPMWIATLQEAIGAWGL